MMRPHDRWAIRGAAALTAAAALGFAREAAAQDPDSQPPLENEEAGRLRIGFNLNAGTGSGGVRSLAGPTLGSTFRAGWQFDRLTAFYGQASVYGWVPSKEGSSRSSFASGVQLTPMLSLTPKDVVELAAGPSLDSLSDAEVPTFSGTKLAIHLRVAFHLGSRNEETGRRHGVTLGFDIHPTFVEGGWFTFYTLGLGYDWL